ncbi:hypothetical protein [Streptococcus suis]|uniref:hypothetical protein n=1 Tax=Streptococcus suis TaxID=1307 RepID=UPI001C9CE52C|nr:hypothetical protein [Streptococcus suis]QZS51312.1 hypothetical protein K6976_00280 [Streptococcus suis]QZS60994.1 hypothetical protein K6972_00280 [Streptococcus suis]HEL1649751.1 hypothetical protein [Streptococcus suis]HEM3429276.1 hypothetical protein [Streptococcus suis]HEM3452009.1 hypothetical protein [Streptococcus suis]
MNVDSVLHWIKNIIITIPDGIVQTLIIGMVAFSLRQTVVKIPIVGHKVSGLISSISSFFNKNSIEISDTTMIIPTPEYIPGRDFVNKKRLSRGKLNKPMSDDEFWGMIFLSLIVVVFIVSWFMKYKNEISLVMKWLGVVPLIISIFILFMVTVSARIQKSTLIYLFYSIPISMLTIYYGMNLLKISDGMSTNLSDGSLMRSLYIIIGLFISVTQQLIAYIMILRNVVIHIARKISVPKFIKKFIYITSFFESQLLLIVTIVILSLISYLMTSGLLISWIQSYSLG